MQLKNILSATALVFQLSGALTQSTAPAFAGTSSAIESSSTAVAANITDQMMYLNETLFDLEDDLDDLDDEVDFIEASLDEPTLNEHGEVIHRPLPKKPRQGALELWSQRRYRGHRVVYGRQPAQCDTVETYTYNRAGFGKSARVIENGTCCQLFTARGCNGHNMVMAGDVASFQPYGMDNKIKSVRCMGCKRLYPRAD
ncbi:hypothetical protein CMQ_1346 [Grosmannia clavigera kw1407]|uniref:Uncharacterized protein n=1 Tax=Grosmannia clavigera (strain kw1407 / UAMH 11150) TaxID=655863 RepID=F0XEK4_GROCL|nr:uncharacterized protein CMQ_1346 [Grosmannia clavigera kw1407]EFX04418.1 hypothetical protein CMQ_1346 [Grosmannia clavigera kw1407]